MGDCDNEEASPPKKAKKFSCQEFRKELKSSEALKSLKKFVSFAKNSEDVVYEYLEGGGSAHEILSLIDSTASGDLTTALPVFEAIHLILLRFQSPDSDYHQECVEVAKLILNSHILTIKSMLSMNITKQKKVALKLLTAIVTMHFSFASEVLNLIQLSPAIISDFIIPSTEKESLRKCFILYTLSFLIESNLATLRNFLDKKGFLNSIIPGLKYDDSNTVNLVLSLFEDKILKNSKINKSLKLKIFNTQIIKALFDLYDWKGPQSAKQLHTFKKTKIKEVEVNQKEKEIVVECVHSFLLLLCCSKKFGIAFVDKGMGTSEQLSNQLLLTVFEGLPDPLKNEKIAEVILKSTASCPDIMKPVLTKLEPFFQPRNSKNWFDAMKFAENLIKEMNVSALIKCEPEIPSIGQIIKAAKALCLPMVFLRSGKSGMEKSHSTEIRLCSLRLLTTMWNEIQTLTTTFPQCEKDLKKSVQYLILKFYPDISDLVELWRNLCDIEFPDISLLPKRHEYLCVVLISLRIVLEFHKESVISLHSLVSGMVKNIEQIKETTNENEFHDLQVKIVQFVELDVESLTPETELFEKSLLILLGSTDNISHASKILSKISVFKEHQQEVDVWMLCYSFLSQEYCSAVAKCLVKAFQQFYNKSKSSFQTNHNHTADHEMEIDCDPSSRKSLSPLLFECIEVLKDLSSSSKTNNQKFKAFQHYLNNIVLHLQHFCTNNTFLFDLIKTEKKLLNKGVINYLKRWKSNTVGSESLDVFTDSLEQEVISWLSDEQNNKNFKDIIDTEKTNCLKLYGIFNTISALLTNKVANGDLCSSDTIKYSEALVYFTNIQDLSVDAKNLISSDLKNLPNFYGNCITCLFRNEFLLNSFNIFEKKNESCKSSTEVIIKVLMESSEIKNYINKNNLGGSWKIKFLDQIRSKLKKNKSIDNVRYLESVLNIFDYDSSEIETLVELLISTSDLNLFINDKKPSTWSVVLVNFIKLSCTKTPLSNRVIKNLCSILKFMCEEGCANLELWDECFIYLLRKHPVHLLAVDNDFVDVVLTRNSPTPATVIFGKLLLNDPSKVNYFIERLSNNLDLIEDAELIFPLLDGLIMRNDSFLETIKSKESCVMWKISEIENKTSPLFKILSSVYKKFKKQIFRTSGIEGNFVSKNLSFLREVVKLFVGEKDTKFIKETINKGIHQPELILEAVKKIKEKETTELYLQGLLSGICQTIKNFKECDEDTIWPRYCAVFSDLSALESDISWKNFLESSEWKEFVKLCIGHCFSTTKHPELLKILRLIITSVSQGSEDKILSLIFQMLISHSQFLSIVLGKSPLKSELVELFYILIQKTPSDMSQKHTPVLLASYNASLSACDQTLLKILKLYENSGVNLTDYEPFVWADSAISHYSVGSSSKLSLWQRFNMVNVLDLLDSNRLEYSLTNFPIHRSLEIEKCSSPIIDSKIYDPAFLLPLFVNLLSPGALVFCLPFVYKGALGYTIRALSSECSDIRLIASVVLSRFYNHLELAQNLKQKLVWMHFINCFRFGIEDLSSSCLPNITTLFFARMTLELSKPPAEMHVPLQKFLLAKSYFVFNSVPEFLPLFQSSEVGHWKHREWLLKVLRDGTETTLDLNLIFHSMAPKIIFCYFHSPLCDNETKKLILQVMESWIKVEKSILLISEYSILNWIQSTNTNCLPFILLDLVKLLFVATDVIIKDIKNPKSTHTNSSHLVQIVNYLIRLLPSVKSANSKEIFQIHIKIILNCMIVFFEEKRYEWFKINKKVLESIIDAGVCILGKNYNSEKFCKVPFYVKDSDEEYDNEIGLDLKNLVYLFSTLTNSIEFVDNKDV